MMLFFCGPDGQQVPEQTCADHQPSLFCMSLQPAVIHFDLKPDNLLIEGEGDDVLVKVADFGLSKHKFQTYVTCHDLRGTLPYMAPELVANPTKVRCRHAAQGRS
jgi:serine/threonine protein kinase